MPFFRVMGVQINDFDFAAAEATAALQHWMHSYGLSLGECACLALAKQLNVPVLTADRAWSAIDAGIEVIQIR